MSKSQMRRRDFLKTGAAAALFAGATTLAGKAAAEPAKLKKAVQSGMLPKDLSDADKFKLAKRCGFEGIEMSGPVNDLDAAKKLGDLARENGVSIHSVVYGGWKCPLSDPDPAVVEKGVAEMESAMRGAKAMGADTVLLVPAIVNAKVRYVEAYERTQKVIPRFFPLADELGVNIAVEFVWNDFLLSPMEFARYVDELKHPRLKAYFDTGNVVAYGYPQDWIRTLGNRIVKIHLKDFKRKERQWVNLRDGDVNWPEVRKALDEVGYSGYITPELDAGDEKYLKDLSDRIDLIIAGK
jgi:hexulose-6-phosphate isomerase